KSISMQLGTAENQLRAPRAGDRNSPFDSRTIVTGLVVFVGYYLGAKLGFALTFRPHPVSILWPPNSILAAALLLTPLRIWWLVLVAAFFGALWGGTAESGASSDGSMLVHQHLLRSSDWRGPQAIPHGRTG